MSRPTRTSHPLPNVVFLFADQHRAQATGFGGNPDVKTPHLDRLARESVVFQYAVAGCPVCSPYRASLLTGTNPFTHGVILNDVPLKREHVVRAKSGITAQDPVFLAEAFRAAGYATGYIGKWHLDGFADADLEAGEVGSRSAFIPPERRCGFEYWNVLECTHNYFHSKYWDSTDRLQEWPGYDAFAQTEAAIDFIKTQVGREFDKTESSPSPPSSSRASQPFCLFVSWGPPHAPYMDDPPQFLEMYDDEEISLELRPNIPEELEIRAIMDLIGYYAHISALDECVGKLVAALDELGIRDNTILVYTSDHGDMLHSQGVPKKQAPWDESIRVPFLLRFPGIVEPHHSELLINAPDIMPTLLGLCGIPVPGTVEGEDLSPYISGEPNTPRKDAALLMCPWPFSQWWRDVGGREYRGIRTARYTYVRDLDGPWLLYDNERDPYQLENRVNHADMNEIQADLDAKLNNLLETLKDEFLPGMEYLKKWGYSVGDRGAIPYRD